MYRILVIMLMLIGLVKVSNSEKVSVDIQNGNFEDFHKQITPVDEKVRIGGDKNFTKRDVRPFISEIDKKIINDYPSYFQLDYIKKKSNVTDFENKRKTLNREEEESWETSEYEDEVAMAPLRSEQIYNEQGKSTKFNFEKQNIFKEKVVHSDEDKNSNFYSFDSEAQKKIDHSNGNSAFNGMGDQRFMKNQNVYNGETETFDDTNFRYPVRPNMNYHSSQSPDFYYKGKGLVINVNTECPPRAAPTNKFIPINKPIRKFMYSPQAQICYPLGFSSYQIPEGNLISSRHMNGPAYHFQ